jgi:hypothetical protein
MYWNNYSTTWKQHAQVFSSTTWKQHAQVFSSKVRKHASLGLDSPVPQFYIFPSFTMPFTSLLGISHRDINS